MSTMAAEPRPLPRQVADLLHAGLGAATGLFQDGGPSFGQRLQASQDKYLHDKLVSLVNDRCRQGSESIQSWREEWALTDATFEGRQEEFFWNAADGRLASLGDFSGPSSQSGIRNEANFNIFMRRVQDEIAQFLGARPRIRMRAHAYDMKAIQAASHLQSTVGEYLWDEQQMDTVQAEAIPLLCKLGTFFLKTEYLPNEGPTVGIAPIYKLDANRQPIPIGRDNQTGETIFATETDENGQQKFREVKEGLHVTTVIDPEDLLVDPTCRDHIQNAAWIIHRKYRDPSWVFNKYKIRVRPQHETDRSFSASRRDALDGTPHGIEVKELWIRKGAYPVRRSDGKEDEVNFPQGYVVIVAGDQLLWHGPNPYVSGKFPFIHVPKIRLRKCLLGYTEAFAMREPQQNINTDIGQWNDAEELCGNPMMQCPTQHMPIDGALGNRAGRVWEYEYIHGIPEPHWVTGVGPSPSLPMKLEVGLRLMNDISGQQPGGMAGGPVPNVEAGVAFATLSASDRQRRQNTALELGRCWREWAEFQVDYIRQFWTRERHISIAGRFNTTRVLQMSGADVPNQIRIGVVPDTTLPQSKAETEQRSVFLRQMGLMDDATLLERLGEDEAEDLSLVTLQMSYCHDILSKLVSDQPVQPDMSILMLMDHGLAAQVYSGFLFDASNREQFPRAYEAVKQLLSFHKNAQENQQMQAALKQIELQAYAASQATMATEGGRAVFEMARKQQEATLTSDSDKPENSESKDGEGDS